MSIIKRSKTPEESIHDISFHVHKFTERKRTDKVLFIFCFSEFGCEVVGSMYCIPRIISENPDCYYIVVGWYGRSYLYHHLVDEFWELKEEFQWLRDKSFAFHHKSVNLAKIEKKFSEFGTVIKSSDLGAMAVGNYCKKCEYVWRQRSNRCIKCGSLAIVKSLFNDVSYWKSRMTPIPPPSQQKVDKAKEYLGENPVGIFARNRSTYGRNLQVGFYISLIKLLERLGYTPIWLGERQTTLKCPIGHIIDITRMEESRDLELTLAIVSQLEFTIQFWTASSRLSAIMATPYLLFESPDQLYGNGQEAYRLSLCTLGKRKLAICQFLSVYKNNIGAINLVERCIKEMGMGNWEDVIGMVYDTATVKRMRELNLDRII